MTRQSNARAVSSTKAGVTDAPPLEIRRTEETLGGAPGAAASAPAMAMKKVGGPARNETRSCATSTSACSGSKRRTNTARIPAAPGTSTPFSRPEMWAMGAGISTASDRPSPCTRAISAAFQLSPRCVCSTALGTPVEPEVKRTSATSEGRLGRDPLATGAPPSVAASAAASDSASGASSTTRAGSTWARARSTSAGPNECSTGRRHGADAPTGPGQHRRGQAVRHLPRHGVAPAARPRSASPPATKATSASASAADRRVAPSTTSPPWAEINASSVGTSHGPPGRR